MESWMPVMPTYWALLAACLIAAYDYSSGDRCAKLKQRRPARIAHSPFFVAFRWRERCDTMPALWTFRQS